MIHRKFLIIFLFLLCLIVLGTLGFWLLEPWSLLDALYMTTITLTTMGSPEFIPLSVTGRVFTIIFSWLGLSILAGSIGFISSALIEGKLLGIYRRKKMNQKIESLKNHVIVCGAGKIGKHVIREMDKVGKSFIVIDKDLRFIEELKNLYQKETGNKTLLYLEGEPSREEILIKAGIQKAEGLISCLPDDAQNLFVALTAKNLNPSVRISSYVIDEVNIPKFYLIGIDEVISGDFLIGKRLTLSMMNHHILSFLEQMNLLGGEAIMYLGDLEISSGSKLIGKSLEHAGLARNQDILVIALKKKGTQNFIFKPPYESLLEAGDILILMAAQKEIRKIQKEFQN